MVRSADEERDRLLTDMLMGDLGSVIGVKLKGLGEGPVSPDVYRGLNMLVLEVSDCGLRMPSSVRGDVMFLGRAFS